MTALKRLIELEKRLPDLTLEELEEAIRIRKTHADLLQPKIRKLALKKVNKLESWLRQKKLQLADNPSLSAVFE